MLAPRIIPCLLVHNNGLVKTQKFKTPKYVGDPINAVKIFNEKEVDEIAVLDIDATVKGSEPDYKMIENLANECRMPLCYGGGIKTVDQAKRIFALGVEKVAISSIAIENEKIVSRIADQVGNQSVVVVIDVKKKIMGGRYEIFTHNGNKRTGKDPFDFAQRLEKLGAGEIVLNSMDNDGMMKGYDLESIRELRSKIDIPMTALGGAGSLNDIARLVENVGIIGASAGSLFVFKGKYRAVLINYPDKKEKEEIYKKIRYQ